MTQPIQTIVAALMLFSLTARAQTNTWAGSLSCRECHAKFYQLWSTSFHGLAMQPYTPQLAKTSLTPEQGEVVAGQYRFRADIQKGVVIESSSSGTNSYPIVQAMGG